MKECDGDYSDADIDDCEDCDEEYRCTHSKKKKKHSYFDDDDDDDSGISIGGFGGGFGGFGGGSFGGGGASGKW